MQIGNRIAVVYTARYIFVGIGELELHSLWVYTTLIG